MIKLVKGGVYYTEGALLKENVAFMVESKKKAACKNTITYGVLQKHNRGGESNLRLSFDALASHDITYVGIIQTARAAGLEEFPVPYILTNCHNSLCAVGGTLNSDDHVFGLTAAKRYGGEFVPENLAVIHQYMREMHAVCGGMILGSDSHTRYGALGTMGVGEGGGEIVKQLLGHTYDIPVPETVAVYLKGKPQKGVGPHDVALELIAATFKKGFLKNKILEFIGPGIKNISVDFRLAVDVMTTETGCLSSIWETDDAVREYYKLHGREGDFKPLHPAEPAYYSSAVVIDLSRVQPMIALPFHPSNAFTIKEFNENSADILAEVENAGKSLCKTFTLDGNNKEGGRVRVNQAIIAGCAGGSYENIAEATEILGGGSIGADGFSLNVYPQSLPVFKALCDGGYVSKLLSEGAVVKPAFCGPCFGACDTPANNGLSVRHTTRNFENREGSKPAEGQLSAVALMDARSIAATAANGGYITPATEAEYVKKVKKYYFDGSAYFKRVYNGFKKADKTAEIICGPNITEIPAQPALAPHVLVGAAASLDCEVVTTDELIPSGEISSYRSNLARLAEFALSRKCPEYVACAKKIKAAEKERLNCGILPPELADSLQKAGITLKAETSYGSFIAAKKIGDGSAREQASSCQKVLGGTANIALEYATKRYRSNLINWGILPLVCRKFEFSVGDLVYIENIRELLKENCPAIPAKLISGGKVKNITLEIGALTETEKEILLAGGLINYYKNKCR